MKLLALDTSQIQASVCVISDTELLASRTGSTSVSHSEGLLPLVEGALADAATALEEIDAFAVGVGPGSFTGLRIGCSTVKGFAQVLEKEILPFSSIRALVLSEKDADVAMANAYQGQVFAGWTGSASGQWQEDALTASDWCQRFGGGRRNLAFCGSGARVYWAKIAAVLENPRLLDAIHVNPEGIFRAVREKLSHRNGSPFVRYDRLQANYMRPSAAEIKFAK